MLFNRRPLAPHARRLQIAHRIGKAMHKQCRTLGCRLNAGPTWGHSSNCEALNYRLAMSEAIADTLTEERAERFGANG